MKPSDPVKLDPEPDLKLVERTIWQSHSRHRSVKSCIREKKGINSLSGRGRLRSWSFFRIVLPANNWPKGQPKKLPIRRENTKMNCWSFF